MHPSRRAAAALLLAASLAACSAAPAPASLGQTETGGASGTTGGAAGAGTTAGPAGGPAGTTGTAPGPAGTTSGTGGSVSGTGGSTGAGVAGPGSGSGGSSATGGGGGAVTSGGSGSTGGAGPATRSQLFTPAENSIGITPTSITMCAHAALTYGAAFNTTDADFNVFWSAVNDDGGIFGRKVTVTYKNDNYDPKTAVDAATACKAEGIFMLLGGIGFDQIPAVRTWAETNHMLYLHHTATVEGSKGLKYSFTELPSVQRMGEGFGQLYLQEVQGQEGRHRGAGRRELEAGRRRLQAAARRPGHQAGGRQQGGRTRSTTTPRTSWT